MTLPNPFSYPTEAHVPVHAPSGYDQYQSYKPWLRDDFVFRCAYCLTRERWIPSASGHAGFGIDHVIAQSANSALVVAYANLVYACNECNSYKGSELLPVNPLTESLSEHLAIDDSGLITGLTPEGRDFVDLLDLASPNRIALRRDRLSVLRIKQKYPEDPDVDRVFRDAFGYPDDLPNLALLRPGGGNANVGSESRSHYARRQRGELPGTY